MPMAQRPVVSSIRWVVWSLVIISISLVVARAGLFFGYSYAMRAYDNGEYSKALPIIYGSALFNDTAACGLLGTMYLFGRGLNKDGQKAEYWLRKAAESGLVAAQSVLGIMFATGQGVPADMIKAKIWLERAASSGDTEAASVLHKLRKGQTI